MISMDERLMPGREIPQQVNDGSTIEGGQICWNNGTLPANGFTACLGRWSGHIRGRMQ
jgi:hypothetical protein